MWRLYGSDGNGIMLCFDHGLLQAVSKNKAETSLGKVLYSNNENRKENYEQASQAYDIQTVNDPVEDRFAACAFVKKDSYQIENEERFVIIRDQRIFFQNGEFITSESKSGIKHRMRGNELVPFVEVHFPIEMLKAIVVGYGLDFEKAKKGITVLFEQYGETYQNVQITQSIHAK